jgi:hypothetical protein
MLFFRRRRQSLLRLPEQKNIAGSVDWHKIVIKAKKILILKKANLWKITGDHWLSIL